MLQDPSVLPLSGFQIFLFTEELAASVRLLLPSDTVEDERCLGSTSLPISGTRTRYRLDHVLSP